jgi:biopolymer transport protein ExbD
MIRYILVAVTVLMITIPISLGTTNSDTIKLKKTPHQESQIEISEDKSSCIEKIQKQQRNIAEELKKIKNILKKQKSN